MRFVVDLGYQRAGGVYDVQITFGGLLEVFRRRPVSGKNDSRANGHFVHVLHGNSAHVLYRFDHVGIVHNLVLDVDGCAEALERNLDHVDSPHYTGAEPPGHSKEDLHSR